MLEDIEYPENRSDINSYIVLPPKSLADKARTVSELLGLVLETFWPPTSICFYLDLYVIILNVMRVLRPENALLKAYNQCCVLYIVQIYLYWRNRSQLIFLAIARTLLLYTTKYGDRPPRIYTIPGRKSDIAPRASLLKLLTCCWNSTLIWESDREQLDFEDVPLLEEDMNTWSLLSKDFTQFWPWFTVQVVLGVLGALLTLAPTYFINQIISAIELDLSPWPYVSGIGLAIMAGATASTQGEYYGLKLSKAVESVYMARVYQHALLGNVQAGNTINLISVDVSQLAHYGAEVHCIVSNPVIMIGGLYYLYNLLGVSMLAGFAVLLLSFPLNWWIGAMQGRLSEKISTIADERIEKTSEIVNGIKPIKFFAWEPRFLQSIMSIRTLELKYLWRKFQFNSATAFIFFCMPLLIVSSSFYSYAYFQDRPLTPSIAFTSIAVFNITQHPLNQLMQIVNDYKSLRVSWDRVYKFLGSKETPKLKVQHVATKLGLENATLAWSNGPLCLKNVSLQLEDGLTVVTGPTGSGKTALLLSLLGELNVKSGKLFTVPLLDRSKASFDVNGLQNTIAYCPQQAWVVNDSLRNNILFGAPMDGRRYKQIVEACELNTDFGSFKYGDGTIVGTRGVTLSGGQKQRIALARALYSSSRFVLLDDVFSALDYTTGRSIYDKLPKLCANRTVVLATHSKWAASKASAVFTVSRGIVRKADITQIEEVPHTAEKSIKFDNDATEAVVEESRAVGNIPLSTYVGYAEAFATKWGWAVIIAAFSITPISEYLNNYWLNVWASSGATRDHQLNHYAGIYAILVCFMGITSTLLEGMTFFGSIRASSTIFEKTIQSVLYAKVQFFDTTPVGQIINRFSKDTHVLDEDVVYHGRVMIRCVLDCFAVILVITWAQPLLIIPVVPILALYWFIGNKYSRVHRELKRLDSISRSPIYQQIEETVTGAISIRAYGFVEGSIRHTMTLIDSYHQCGFNTELLNLWLAFWGNAISSLVVTLAAIFVVKGNLSAGMAGVTLSYSMLLNDSVHWTTRLWGILQASMNSVERLFEYESIERERSDGHGTLGIGGDIQFKNLSVRYQANYPLVLEDVNFTISSGEKVGVVGRTGSGKSTLISALFRMVEPAAGSILINGVDIQTVSLAELRKTLAIIPQDPTLFGGTLRSNLDPEDVYSDSELMEIINKVHLPFSVGQEISTGGTNMSQGQRQLVCLARALLRKPSIIVMDEATASIDHETDELIQKMIKEELNGATVLTIAHRVETIQDCSVILEVSDGKVTRK